MKNKIKIDLKKPFFMATMIILLSVGCVSLDENPKDFPSPEKFYSTESQIVSALTGSMGDLYQRWGIYSYGWYEFHTDHNDDADLAFTANHGKSNWQGHYKAISILNSVISALNEDKLGDTVPQEKKDELMGLAKFLRGFNYFFLVRLFGDVPIITEETDLIQGGDISRQPVKDVYTLIEADFTVAISNLPDTWAPQFAGQPSKDAARGFLAKVYLTMATAPLNDASYYAKAKTMAGDVIGNGVFSLIPDVRDVFKLENKLGPENMFSFNATEDDHSSPPQIWLPESMADGWADFGLQKAYTDIYPDQPRKEAYMILEDWDGESYDTFWRGAPLIRKFVYNDKETMEKLNSTANIPLLRYADVLMMFAEADNMVNGGPTQAAVDALNLVIDRANDGNVNANHPRATMGMSLSEFDDAVINERSFELFFEYDRWFDLIRKRILCEAVRPEIQVNCSDDDYLWPIPQSDLRINPLMTQNPGYPIPGDE